MSSWHINIPIRAGKVNCIPGFNMVDEIDFLRILIDSNLTWTPHIDQLYNRINTSLYALKHIKAFSDLSTTRTAHFILCESHFIHGLAVWKHTSNTNVNIISSKPSKKTIRILTNIHPQWWCR